MYSVNKIAQCILNEQEVVATMKLQKLVYYSHAVSLVTHNEPLFGEKIEAWANGPVINSLYQKHKGMFLIPKGLLGDASINTLDSNSCDAIRHVLDTIGSYSGNTLSNLVRNEAPWLDARGTTDPWDRSSTEISPQSIKNYYSSPLCSNPLFTFSAG